MKKLNKGNINKCHESVKNSVIKVAVSYRRIGFYSDWVCTAVMSNDVMKDLRG